MKNMSLDEMEEGAYILVDSRYNSLYFPHSYILIIRSSPTGKTFAWLNWGEAYSGDYYMQQVSNYPGERHDVIKLTALGMRVYGVDVLRG